MENLLTVKSSLIGKSKHIPTRSANWIFSLHPIELTISDKSIHFLYLTTRIKLPHICDRRPRLAQSLSPHNVHQPHLKIFLICQLHVKSWGRTFSLVQKTRKAAQSLHLTQKLSPAKLSVATRKVNYPIVLWFNLIKIESRRIHQLCLWPHVVVVVWHIYFLPHTTLSLRSTLRDRDEIHIENMVGAL